MDEETAHVILDAQADIIALRAAMKMLLRQTYGIGDQALGVIREEALAGVENGFDGDEPDERERYFQEALREAMTDLLTPMRA